MTDAGMQTNKIWVDNGSRFYKKSLKTWLQNNIEMYQMHSKGKSIVIKRFTRNLKNII